MSRKFYLRKYQEEILARIGQQAEAGVPAAQGRLGVGIGHDRVLVSLDEISEVVPVPELTTVPLTCSWFLGIANVRGVLYSIVDLALMDSGEQKTVTPTHLKDNSRLLLFHEQFRQQAGVVVDRVIGLRNVGQMTLKTLGSDHPFWAKQSGYEDEDGDTWLELDIESLIVSREFAQPGIS